MKVIYTNTNNESVETSRFGTFRLIDIQGLGKVDADVQTVKSPYQDGSTYIDTLLEERTLILEIGIHSHDEKEIYVLRSKISRMFNPKRSGGVLRIEYEGGVKEIVAIPSTTVDFPTGSDNTSTTFQRVLIELICPDPYWLSENTQTKPLANWIGGFGFPLQFSGRNIQFAKRGTVVEINNDGDVPTPIFVEFKGGAVNPIIRNQTTGEFIKLNQIIADGEVLEIDTSFGRKRIEKIGPNNERTNVLHWIDLKSRFFQLQPGVNVIEYNSDGGIEKSTVRISFKTRHLAI